MCSSDLLGHVRSLRLKRHPEPGEQLAAVAGGRGKDERWSRVVHVGVTCGFDVRNLLTYDAPPMSGSLHAWYSRRELEALADRDGAISGELEIRRFARFVGMLHSDAGSVKASLEFDQRRDGWLGVGLRYEAVVELTCQRCLEPFRHELAGYVNVVLADDESTSATVQIGRAHV